MSFVLLFSMIAVAEEAPATPDDQEERPAEDGDEGTAVEPEETAEPEEAATPEETAEPEEAATPEETAEPEEAATPEETAEPEEAATPEETAEPEEAEGGEPEGEAVEPLLEGTDVELPPEPRAVDATVISPALTPDRPEQASSDEVEEADEVGLEGQTFQGSEQVWENALPFRGTTITYENIFNAYQLNRGNELTYNPYYAMSLSIRPRWYFTDALSLRLRFDVEGELTDADTTTNYHETRASDLYVDLVYNPIVTIPRLELDVGAGLRMQFPTSLESQAETRYLALGMDLRLARVFDVLDGLVFAYAFRYMKYLNRYTTLERDSNPYYGTPVQPGASDSMDPYLPPSYHWNDPSSFGGLPDMARSHGLFNQILVQLNFLEDRFRPMSLAVMVQFINYLSYEPSEASVPLIGGEADVPVEHIYDPQTHSAAIWYVIELGIDITDYLNLAVGTSTLSPQLRPNSTYREPFFNRYTNIYVDLSLDIERLVAAVRQ